MGTKTVTTVTLPKVGADGVLFFQGPMTVAVQWQMINGGTIGSL
jgi:hypothetical protein